MAQAGAGQAQSEENFDYKEKKHAAMSGKGGRKKKTKKDPLAAWNALGEVSSDEELLAAPNPFDLDAATKAQINRGVYDLCFLRQMPIRFLENILFNPKSGSTQCRFKDQTLLQTLASVSFLQFRAQVQPECARQVDTCFIECLF